MAEKTYFIDEIIEHMPDDRQLYSTVIGPCRRRLIKSESLIYLTSTVNPGHFETVTLTGHGREDNVGECVLFPSKEIRNWDKWAVVLVRTGDLVMMDDGTVVRFDPCQHLFEKVRRFASQKEYADQKLNVEYKFEPFMQILARHRDSDKWIPKFFGFEDDHGRRYATDGFVYSYMIPYLGNEDKYMKT
jgi:hypothetical protein